MSAKMRGGDESEAGTDPWVESRRGANERRAVRKGKGRRGRGEIHHI